jgi:hypothetical protein
MGTYARHGLFGSISPYLGKSWFKAKNTTSGRFDVEIAFLIQI